MLHDFDYVDVSNLPEHMQGAVRRYLNDGIMPGDFFPDLFCHLERIFAAMAGLRRSGYANFKF